MPALLEACRSFGWTSIAARQVKHLTDAELRAIELDENTQRENLSDFETTRGRLAQIRQAEAALKAKARAEELRGPAPQKSPGSSVVPRSRIQHWSWATLREHLLLPLSLRGDERHPPTPHATHSVAVANLIGPPARWGQLVPLFPAQRVRVPKVQRRRTSDGGEG